VAYKKDQGRYARMTAFWALIGLFAYGCLGGLAPTLASYFGRPWVSPFPLIGHLGWDTVIALGVLLAIGFVIHRLLNRPKIADLLIDTETELRKVTWPTLSETWVGTMAVAIAVLVMLVFVSASDYVLTFIVQRIFGLGS
jgi:preprotein translocase SecE subunit